MNEIDAVPIPIHIGNVDGQHTVSPETLLALTEAYEDVFEHLNTKVSIRIGVPRRGSWESTIWLFIGYVGFSPVITLLTGKTADEWAKLSREAIASRLTRLLTSRVDELPEETPDDFYRKRNKLFNRLESDTAVSDLKLSNLPAIPRADFPLYIAKLSDEDPVYIGEVEILVSSPDWKGKRSWRGRITDFDSQSHSFIFDRQLCREFWRKIVQNDLNLRTEDTMLVQLAYHPADRVKYKVLRVLNYNGDSIDSPLKDEFIHQLYTEFQQIEPDAQSQLSLFNDDN